MDTLVMSARERRRLTVFALVEQKRLSVAGAGRQLGLSERQAWRLWNRYRRDGDAGLVHGLRGRVGNASLGALRERVLALYVERYRGLGAAHAAELMAGEHQVQVSRQTLWRWLKSAGLVVEQRRVSPHRIRRPRKSCLGELVQMDGSTHAWLGPASPSCVLFVMIDDASSRVWARFYASEDTASAFDLFGGYVRREGLPAALYVDRDSIYRVNDEKAREHRKDAGKRPPLTQFGRAMDELEVTVIFARSPQAKGRVERVNRTLQDRLVKELALAGITTIDAANAYLDGGFLDRLHQLIGVEPASRTDLHRPLPEGTDLEQVLCVREQRIVGRDWCVRYANRVLQIDRRHGPAALPGKRVEVLQLADGALRLRRHGQPLTFTELAHPPESPASPSAPKRTLADRTPWRPGPNHPWKRAPALAGVG